MRYTVITRNLSYLITIFQLRYFLVYACVYVCLSTDFGVKQTSSTSTMMMVITYRQINVLFGLMTIRLNKYYCQMQSTDVMMWSCCIRLLRRPYTDPIWLKIRSVYFTSCCQSAMHNRHSFSYRSLKRMPQPDPNPSDPIANRPYKRGIVCTRLPHFSMQMTWNIGVVSRLCKTRKRSNHKQS